MAILALLGMTPGGRAAATVPGATDTLAPSLVAPAGHDAWRKIVTGSLRNGVRYAILPRAGNEPGVGLLMRNAGGFIAERRPGERGLAHLIEHLVFLSPTERAADDLRHGLRIGLPLTLNAPSAGSTSWRESNYYLSTRTGSSRDLDTLLALFREVASELTLRADAVEIGRGEVVREMADKKLGNQIYGDYIAAVAPGSPNDVIDAQNSDDVPTASIETIRGLYHRLYRPEAMMIVVVGDVEAARTKALIRERFGSWRRSLPGPAPMPAPKFRPERIRPISFSALPQGRRTAIISVVMPTPTPSPAREQQARDTLMDLLAARAVNDRLAASQPTSPPGKTGIFIENGEQGHRQIMLWDNFAAGQWQPAVAGLRKMTCDLAAAGFTEVEWAAAKRNTISDLDARVRTMAAVPNVELAKDLSHAMADGRTLIAPDEMRRYALRLLPTIGAEAGSGWWRRQWRASVEHFRVEAPELAPIADPEAAIRATADGAVEASACKVRGSRPARY